MAIGTTTVATVTTALLKYKKEVLSLLKGLSSEAVNLFDIGLTKYVSDREGKLSKINTFISRSEKLNFYDVYYPLTLKNRKLSFTSREIIENIFKESNTAGIIGGAGSGKTMLMKHLFLSCRNELQKIPLFIELRDFNNNPVSLEDFIHNLILGNNIKPTSEIMSRALKSGKFIFLFDGYDEVSFEKKASLTIELENLIDKHNNNQFVFTSRPGTNIESLSRLHPFYVQPLTQNEIETFIDIQLKGYDDGTLSQKLKLTIKNSNNRDYIHYVSSPLLLSMFILTYGVHPELPNVKNKFFWNVFDTLCTRHDSISKKGGWVHPKKTKLQNHEIESILKSFSISTLLEDQFNFDKQYIYEKLKRVVDKLGINCNIDELVYDLTVSISILLEEGLEYKFPHRTMQDYFSALFIREQSDQSKKKIYSEKILKCQPYVLPNQTLFELCSELDKEAYIEYYLLPIIKSFNEEFTASLDDNIINLIRRINLKYEFLTHVDGSNFSCALIDISIDPLPYIEVMDLFSRAKYNPFEFNYKKLHDEESQESKFLYPVLEPQMRNSQSGLILLNIAKMSKKNILLYCQKLNLKMQLKEHFDFMKNKEIEVIEELKIEKEKKAAMWDFED